MVMWIIARNLGVGAEEKIYVGKRESAFLL